MTLVNGESCEHTWSTLRKHAPQPREGRMGLRPPAKGESGLAATGLDVGDAMAALRFRPLTACSRQIATVSSQHGMLHKLAGHAGVRHALARPAVARSDATTRCASASMPPGSRPQARAPSELEQRRRRRVRHEHASRQGSAANQLVFARKRVYSA